MMTSASTSSFSKTELGPSLSEVVTRVWPWSSSHLRMPSSFSVVPRRAGTWNSLISKAVLYLKYVYLYIIFILHELGVESPIFRQPAPLPAFSWKKSGMDGLRARRAQKRPRLFLVFFPQIVVTSADSTIGAELHAVGTKGQKKLPAQVIVV